MKKIIIFDFDGVIINEYEKHYKLSKKQFTNLTEEEFKKFFEGNVHEERKKLKERNTGYDLKSSFNNHKKTITIKPEIKHLLEKLSKNYKLGIISSAMESGADQCLKNSNLENLFSFNYGYETNPSKVEKFKKVLNKYNIKPDECIFITDTLGDILEAKKVRIKSIAINSGYHEKERLKKGNPWETISNLKELESIL